MKNKNEMIYIPIRQKGVLRFVKRKYYEMGNRASRLLAFQLRKAQSSRVVSKMKHPDTKKVTSQSKEIAEAFAVYYKKLYEGQEVQGKEDKISCLLDSVELDKLSQEEADMMCSPITVEEPVDSIGKLKNNRSPGIDGGVL